MNLRQQLIHFQKTNILCFLYLASSDDIIAGRIKHVAQDFIVVARSKADQQTIIPIRTIRAINFTSEVPK